jgi:hypothetical protein
MKTTRPGGPAGAVASLIGLLAACGGVVDLKTQGTAGVPAIGDDDAGGKAQAAAGATASEGGSSSTGGKTPTGGKTSTGGTSPTAGMSSAGTQAIDGIAGTNAGPCSPTPGAKAGDGIDTAIDSLDDDDTTFVTAGVGMGSWYWDKDAVAEGTISPANTATLAPVAGGRSGKALHVTGSGLTGWGAGLGASLNGLLGSFDASNYGGIAFFIKGTTQVYNGTNKLMIMARMPDILPGPGSCCDSTPGNECYGAHQLVIDVPADWKEVKIAWADFKNPTWGLGQVLVFNPNRIRDIAFAFNHFSSGAEPDPISFDVWIDGLRFLASDELSSVAAQSGGDAGQ